MENFIYKTLDEKHVKAVLLYPNTDKKLYHDAEFKKPVTKDSLREIFLLGAFIVGASGAMTMATAFSVSGDTATVTAGENSYTSVVVEESAA